MENGTTTAKEVAAGADEGATFKAFHDEWSAIHRSDLADLERVLSDSGVVADNFTSNNFTVDDFTVDTVDIREVVDRCLRHHEEHDEARFAIAGADAPALYCSAFCSSFESAFLWLGGFRPSLSIRLLYSINGGADIAGVLRGGMSTEQLWRVNELHEVVIREEDRLSSRMATLQEDVADEPLFRTATKAKTDEAKAAMGAMARHGEAMGVVLRDADRLRVGVMRELATAILAPQQVAALLLATKRLALAVHSLGIQRDAVRRRGGGG